MIPVIPVINIIPIGVDKAINARIINTKQIDTDTQVVMFISFTILFSLSELL